jgi:hypothetical protein
MNDPTPISLDKITDADLMLARAHLTRIFSDLEHLTQFSESVLDKPEDRLYHAEDRTWWRREGLTLKTADPPPEIHALQAALAQAISQGCTCDHLYGAMCNIHRLATPAGIQEAVDHLKALEEAVLFVKQFLLNLEGADCGDPLRDIRKRCHAPLHAKLDAALKGVRNV